MTQGGGVYKIEFPIVISNLAPREGADRSVGAQVA